MVDIEDEILQRAAAPIFHSLKRFVGGQITGQNLREIRELIHFHTLNIRRRHPTFPDLVPVLLPRQGFLEVVRADLDHAGITQLVKNYIVRFPRISGYELAEAIKTSFPDYRPQI